MADLKGMTDWSRLQALLDQHSEEKTLGKVDEHAFFDHLRSRVKGQDKILADVAKLLRLQLAKSASDRPVANLLFLGPTGTGKTELAKAMAEYLFGDEKAMVRFDCSEFTGGEAKTRLIGTPLGYVGSEMGGQLTRPVQANPRRLILFDEIEKAYKDVFDLFLQMMGEGRLTEQGSGKTANFTQSIIVLTSNAHADEIGKIQKEAVDYHEMVNAVKSHLADTKVFRPEILGRIDKVYVFEPLEGIVIAEIALLKLQKLAREYRLQLDFVSPELLVKTLVAGQKVSRFGVRELDRIVFEMFASKLIDAREAGASRVRIEVDQDSGPRVVPVTSS